MFSHELRISIQAPNVFRAVLTTENSVCSGGHFYTYETMHLVEAARLINVARVDNVAYAGVFRNLDRMAIALRAPGCLVRNLSKLMLRVGVGTERSHLV